MDRYEEQCAALGLCLASNVPVILWGPPGQGKSSVVAHIAREYDLHLETVIASIREPSDFAGLPIVDAGGATVTLAPPRWARALAGRPGGVVFFDEMSTAPPAVQSAMLRVVLDRVVGDLALPATTRMVAAANPPGQAADGWDLTAPMANRFCHLSWTLPAETVRDGFSYGWAPTPVPKLDPDQLELRFGEAKRLVGAFLGSRPELLTRVPSDASDAGFAFPTPRTWELAARLYAACAVSGLGSGSGSAVRSLLLDGCVGLPAAAEFMTFVKSADLPDPEALLADPDSYRIPRTRGDIVYAIASSVWSATVSNLDPPRWTACGRVLARIADAGHADVAFATGQRWLAGRPEGAVPEAASMRSLAPILKELGRLPSGRRQ